MDFSNAVFSKAWVDKLMKLELNNEDYAAFKNNNTINTIFNYCDTEDKDGKFLGVGKGDGELNFNERKEFLASLKEMMSTKPNLIPKVIYEKLLALIGIVDKNEQDKALEDAIAKESAKHFASAEFNQQWLDKVMGLELNADEFQNFKNNKELNTLLNDFKIYEGNKLNIDKINEFKQALEELHAQKPEAVSDNIYEKLQGFINLVSQNELERAIDSNL